MIVPLLFLLYIALYALFGWPGLVVGLVLIAVLAPHSPFRIRH